MRLYILLASFILLISCAADNYYSPLAQSSDKKWQGAPVSELLRVMGTPDEKIDQPAGGQLYIYRKSTSAPNPPTPPVVGIDPRGAAVVINNPATPAPPSPILFCETRFVINAAHVITSVSRAGYCQE